MKKKNITLSYKMKDILNTYSAIELKKFIANANIKGVSKMKKAELVNLMTKEQHLSKFHHIKPKGKGKAPVKAPVKAKPNKVGVKKKGYGTGKGYKSNEFITKEDDDEAQRHLDKRNKLNKERKKQLLKKGYGIQKKRNKEKLDKPKKKLTNKEKLDELDEGDYSIATYEKLYPNKKKLTKERKKKLLKKGYGIQKKRNVATTKKTEDFLGSIETTYSPNIPHQTVYEDFATAPTYDTGYDVDMSQIIDPLTFDYNVKYPIFHKGTIPFDKKKHDKGIMPKEIWEGVYGEDLDTPSEIIRGNNLTPQMKEDIKLTELKAKHELTKTRMKKKAEDKAKYAEKSKLHRQKRREKKLASLPEHPITKGMKEDLNIWATYTKYTEETDELKEKKRNQSPPIHPIMKNPMETILSHYKENKVKKEKEKIPPVPANKLEVKARPKFSSIRPRKKKVFKPKIVKRTAKGAIASKAPSVAIDTMKPLKTSNELTLYNKKIGKSKATNEGGGQAHPDFRREQKRMGYTDYNSGQKVYDEEGTLEGEDWELDPTHPQYKAPIKYSYSHLGKINKSGVVSGGSGINILASNTQIRIRGREEKQEEGQATNNQKSKLNAGLLAGIERQKLKKKGIIVRLNNDSVFTKKGKQEFADKFITQAKTVDKKMSKEWIKKYVETKRKERPNKEYGNKTEAFSKMAELMFNDYDKESKKSRPLMLKGKEDKYQTQKKAFQDKFNAFNKQATFDLKGDLLTPAKKKKLKEQLEQKRKRLDINLKKLGEKFNK